MFMWWWCICSAGTNSFGLVFFLFRNNQPELFQKKLLKFEWENKTKNHNKNVVFFLILILTIVNHHPSIIRYIDLTKKKQSILSYRFIGRFFFCLYKQKFKNSKFFIFFPIIKFIELKSFVILVKFKWIEENVDGPFKIRVGTYML